MSLGPAEILVILVVALIVFGPKRLPEVGRQVGQAMRELRKMQDQVRAEFDTVIHPDVSPSETTGPAALEEPDHRPYPEPSEADDGFAGPSSFS
jgi:sec-independent protein translocase protein TatA